MQEDFQTFIRNVQVPNPMQVLAPLRRELLEAAHTAGYAKPTLIQMQAYVKKRPLLDDTTAQDGPYAIILAPRQELVIHIEKVLSQFNHIVLDEADKRMDLGFEDHVIGPCRPFRIPT